MSSWESLCLGQLSGMVSVISNMSSLGLLSTSYVFGQNPNIILLIVIASSSVVELQAGLQISYSNGHSRV